jgi:hypothetical protein
MKNIKFLLLFLLLLSSCKTTDNDSIKKVFSNKNNFDKFEDNFDKNKYINKTLKFSMDFDADWIIMTNYQNFDNLQKKFARYFSSEYSEVLFVGFNDKKKIGLRATVESLGLENTKYVEKLKLVNTADFTNYAIKILNDKEVTLTNIQAYSLIYEMTLNAKNIFTFDSIIFKNQNNNFRIDMWILKNDYENQKQYILSLFQTIDIIDIINEPQKDATTDTTIKDKK